MGRRKQLRPTRLSDDISPSTPLPPDLVSCHKKDDCLDSDLKASVEDQPRSKKSKVVDFSIKAQLSTLTPTTLTFTSISTSTSENTVSSNATMTAALQNAVLNAMANNMNPYSLVSAIKAYDTLINDLSYQMDGSKFLHLASEVNKLASKNQHQNHLDKDKLYLASSNGLSGNKATKYSRKSSLSVALPNLNTAKTDDNKQDSPSALDLRIKPKEDVDALGKLSSLVGQAGSSMTASMAAVVKSVNRTMPTTLLDDNDPCKVFTCLQCFERFSNMLELTEHMRVTNHYGQNAKFNGHQFPVTPTSLAHDTNNKSAATNGSNAGGNRLSTYRYKCAICGYCNDLSIDEHMRNVHSISKQADWLAAVKLVPI